MYIHCMSRQDTGTGSRQEDLNDEQSLGLQKLWSTDNHEKSPGLLGCRGVIFIWRLLFRECEIQNFKVCFPR
jgi:hypothetical protein